MKLEVTRRADIFQLQNQVIQLAQTINYHQSYILELLQFFLYKTQY